MLWDCILTLVREVEFSEFVAHVRIDPSVVEHDVGPDGAEQRRKPRLERPLVVGVLETVTRAVRVSETKESMTEDTRVVQTKGKPGRGQ